MKTNSLKSGGKIVLLALLLFTLTFIFLMPIVWIIFSSFKNAGELFSWPPSLLGKNPSFQNYRDALSEGDFIRYFMNTVFTSVVATILTVMVNVMSGYAFAKYRFKGQKILFAIVLATLMVPLEVIMIPVFKVIVATNLYNNLWGLIIPAVASPTAVFLVRQYYMGITSAYMEAARIDGASEFYIFTKIMLPMAKPIISVLCIFSFMWRWNDYLWPKLVINSKTKYTLQLALANFSGEYSVDWKSLLAMSVISMIPVIIVFISLQKYIIGGMTAGGVKE
ncbi:sn-glycerol-3-phosphate transport system permease protein UgpE [Anaerocolumna cellulosilytica]|uniref:sn-glycerol-3-phosphate transport system permease protein UgpE n=1 Tax=Anaerocolumna cellulosilytica TaxID=433286 RepID=A0A6S6R0M1_9FIRM|nr:carbohydrate ABC transporter permease [Anaerocolumna cellulosilytica]MBB5193917.1 alpha-1,4-digalacturonate transport system permease protein [Anaerocolumna cellulosilytica]BCJ94869.1 sn-glycerol-3-phosphate transport system permease protein UgpE [Anaerocolumna cellulosilytica]